MNLTPEYVRKLPWDSLSALQHRVLPYLAQGYTAKATGRVLGLSTHAVDCHRYRILKKLGLHSQFQLVRCVVIRELDPGFFSKGASVILTTDDLRDAVEKAKPGEPIRVWVNGPDDYTASIDAVYVKEGQICFEVSVESTEEVEEVEEEPEIRYIIRLDGVGCLYGPVETAEEAATFIPDENQVAATLVRLVNWDNAGFDADVVATWHAKFRKWCYLEPK